MKFEVGKLYEAVNPLECYLYSPDRNALRAARLVKSGDIIFVIKTLFVERHPGWIILQVLWGDKLLTLDILKQDHGGALEPFKKIDC